MINILEILEKVPNLEDMVFYSPLYGDVKARIGYTPNSFNSEALIEIYTESKVPFFLNNYGQRTKEGECLLFPSKQQRDWSKFRIPRKELPEGTRVVVWDSLPQESTIRIRRYYRDGGCFRCDELHGNYIPWKYIIPVDKFNFNDFSFKNEDNYGIAYKGK